MCIRDRYTVDVKFAGQQIPKSPFLVGVKGKAGDPSKVTASGPGLEQHGVIEKKKTHFEVYTKGKATAVRLQVLGLQFLAAHTMRVVAWRGRPAVLSNDFVTGVHSTKRSRLRGATNYRPSSSSSSSSSSSWRDKLLNDARDVYYHEWRSTGSQCNFLHQRIFWRRYGLSSKFFDLLICF